MVEVKLALRVRDAGQRESTGRVQINLQIDTRCTSLPKTNCASAVEATRPKIWAGRSESEGGEATGEEEVQFGARVAMRGGMAAGNGDLCESHS